MFQIVIKRFSMAVHYKYVHTGVEHRYAGVYGGGAEPPLQIFRKLPCYFRDEIMPRITIPSVVFNAYKS